MGLVGVDPPTVDTAPGSYYQRLVMHHSAPESTRPTLGGFSLSACSAALMLALLAPGPLAAEPAATPYRPTISNPAELPEPGWLDAELGWQYVAKGANVRRHSMPYLLKFAFNEDFGLLLGGDSYVSQVEQKDSSANDGFGSVSGFAKARFEVNETSVFGLELGAAHQSFEGGTADFIANGIYSQDMGPVRLDANLSFSRLGVIDDGEGRYPVGWAVALGFPIAGQWGGAIEFAGSYRRGADPFAQFLATANYTWHPRVVFDFGVATGLTSASQDITVFAGVTALLWQVF